jgi:hypothetical protein
MVLMANLPRIPISYDRHINAYQLISGFSLFPSNDPDQSSLDDSRPIYNQ